MSALRKKKILAISGSTRSNSVNLHILKAIAAIYRVKADFEIFAEIDQLPHFNPDLDAEPFPPTIVDLRRKMEMADRAADAA